MPFVELLAHSADLAAREQADPLHMDARFLLGYALPEYWGRPSGFQIAGFLVARAFYVGALPLMLAAWAVMRGRRASASRSPRRPPSRWRS